MFWPAAAISSVMLRLNVSSSNHQILDRMRCRVGEGPHGSWRCRVCSSRFKLALGLTANAHLMGEFNIGMSAHMHPAL